MENRYRRPGPEDLAEAIASMSPRGDWTDSLMRYFASGGIMAQREAVMARAWQQQALEPEASKDQPV